MVFFFILHVQCIRSIKIYFLNFGFKRFFFAKKNIYTFFMITVIKLRSDLLNVRNPLENKIVFIKEK